MQIPKSAIEKAILEGEWKIGGELWRYDESQWEKIALDPTFWQALGKALGWEKTQCLSCHEIVQPGEDTLSTNVHCDHKNMKDWQNRWRDKAHHFYDLILTSGDTEKFWADLLQN